MLEYLVEEVWGGFVKFLHGDGLSRVCNRIISVMSLCVM